MRNPLSSGSGLGQFRQSTAGNGGDVNALAPAPDSGMPYMIPGLAAYYTAKNAQYTADASNRVSQWYDVSGNSGSQLLNFNGTAQCSVANLPAFGTGDLTVVAWVKFAAINTVSDQIILGGLANSFSLVQVNGTTKIYASKPGVGYASSGSSTALSADTLYCIAYSRTGTTGTYYLNGAADGTTADSFNYSVASTLVGSASKAQSIQNVLIYNRALSAGEVASLYANGPYGIPPASGLKLSPTVPFTRGATTITDTSGNSATITLPASGVWISGARDLAQVTGANQPQLIPWSGSNYLYLPGVAGNYASTPDSAAVSITGDIDIRWYGSLSDWTPANFQVLVGKFLTTGNQRSYLLGVASVANGSKLDLTISANGTATTTVRSTLAPTVADGASLWIRVTITVNNGAGGWDAKFYTSTDGVTWTQLGTTVTTAGTTSIFDSTALLEIGTYDSGTQGYVVPINCYRAQIYNGINGTLVADFNPALALNNAATVTASTGEVWTVASTGAKPAQIVGYAQMLFDGSAYYLKTAPFTLNQPTTVYLVGKQNTWSSTAAIYDGNSADTMELYQHTSSPNVTQYYGTDGGTVTTWATLENSVICAVFNGTSSLLRENRGPAQAGGGAGANNGGGFTLGARADALKQAAIQASEVLIFSQAHDTATQDRIIKWLGARNAINV